MRTKDRSSIKTAQAQRLTLFEAMAATRAAVTLAVQAKNRLRTSTRRLSTNPMYSWPGNSCRALLIAGLETSAALRLPNVRGAERSTEH